jgi:hypothetical protein
MSSFSRLYERYVSLIGTCLARDIPAGRIPVDVVEDRGVFDYD